MDKISEAIRSTLFGGGIAVACFAGAFKLVGVISSPEIDQYRYMIAFLFTCFVLMLMFINSTFSEGKDDLKQQLAESKEETSKLRDDMNRQLAEAKEETSKVREEKIRELTKAKEETSKEREKLKENSEDWHKINEQRKTEAINRESAEREREALKHQVKQQEERFLKMEGVPFDKMKEFAPMKVQLIEKIEKLEEENLKLMEDFNEERKLLGLRLEARETDLQLSKAKSDQLQKGIGEVREELNREIERSRKSMEEGQQRIEELKEENGKLMDDLNEERKLHEACKTDLQLAKAKSDQLQKGIDEERNERTKQREELNRERDRSRKSKEEGQRRIEKLDRRYNDEKRIKEERERNLELVTAARDQEIQKRKNTEKERDEQIQITDRRTKERDQEQNAKQQEMKRARELEGKLANLQTKEKNLREKHVDDVNTLRREHKEENEKLKKDIVDLKILAGEKALEKKKGAWW